MFPDFLYRLHGIRLDQEEHARLHIGIKSVDILRCPLTPHKAQHDTPRHGTYILYASKPAMFPSLLFFRLHVSSRKKNMHAYTSVVNPWVCWGAPSPYTRHGTTRNIQSDTRYRHYNYMHRSRRCPQVSTSVSCHGSSRAGCLHINQS